MVQRHKKSPLSKTYSWFFSDIIASSDPAIYTIEQLEKIEKLNELLSKTEILSDKDDKRIVTPTGDGYVIGFLGSTEKPLILAKDLLTQIEKNNKRKHGKDKLVVRVGIDEGPVYTIIDLNNQKSSWGPGIITAKRVMDLAKENQILASKRIADATKKLTREYKSLFHSIGKYEIKHGEKIEIYNVYGKGFGNKIFPRKGKDIQRKESDKERRSPSNFKFKRIEITLDVTDPNSMMTHHTYIWNIVNISRHSHSQILYQLGGDIERDFSDLNVKVTDANRNKLKIVRIEVNKPLYKEFYVKLKQPVKSRRELKGLKLEYDWEEPDREFVFVLPTDCKKFSFKSIIPKGAERKIRIFKRVGLSEKQLLEPDIKHGKKKTKILWEGKNLNAHDEYTFQW